MKSEAEPTPGSGTDTHVVTKAPADAAQVASKADASGVDGAPLVDAAQVASKVDASSAPVVDATQVATAPADAAAPIDAKTAAPPVDAAVAVPAGNSDQLTITSTPAGARVYLDGADTGVTPVKLPGSPDRHHRAPARGPRSLHRAGRWSRGVRDPAQGGHAPRRSGRHQGPQVQGQGPLLRVRR